MNKSITDQSTNRLTGMCDVKMKHLGNAKAFEDKQTSMKRLKYEFFPTFHSLPRDIITNRNWRLYRQPPHVLTQNFPSSTNRNWIYVWVLCWLSISSRSNICFAWLENSRATLSETFTKSSQPAGWVGAVSLELLLNEKISDEVYIRGSNTQTKITDGIKKKK